MKRLAFTALLLLPLGCSNGPKPRGVHHPLLGEIGRGEPGRVVIGPASASKVSFTRMGKTPEPGNSVPRGATWSPDGALLTYLASESGDETMSLFAFDVATGRSEVILRAADLGASRPLSREEELRRERQREKSEGIASHQWAKHAKVLLVPHAGDLFVLDFAKDAAPRRLTKTEAPELDAKLCPTGERVAFVRGGELFAIDVATGKETALTRPVPGLTHGLSDFLGQEELREPSGYVWSPTCDRIVYLEVDERPVAQIPVAGYRGEADVMVQRYPRTGAKNALVRAGIIDVATRSTTWLGPADPGRYLGRFTWSDDGSSLYWQSLARDQKKVTLLRADRAGRTTEIASESSPAWVGFLQLKFAGERLVTTSTRSGHQHLELRGKDGVKALTSGAWDVDHVIAADTQRVLFTATKEGPLERHLYAVGLGDGQITRLTQEHGVHAIIADAQGTAWLDQHSGEDRPPAAVVVRDGKPVGALPSPVDPEIAALGIRPQEHLTIPSVDGEPLQAVMLKPRRITGKHPVVMMVYGGPESQLVWDKWAPHLMWQHLADRGFVVFQIDGRGTAGRGIASSQKVHKRLGQLELEDQITAAKWLASQPFVDGTRIGIYGHSYGGYMAARAMVDGGGVFKVGVAGSPVTDFRLYDSAYTERYMETPETNPAGYEASDLNKKAAGLQGKLLLIHALMDENVHFTNTARFVDALVAADRPFDLLVLPGERHGYRAPAVKAYVPEKVVGYFAEHL